MGQDDAAPVLEYDGPIEVRPVRGIRLLGRDGEPELEELLSPGTYEAVLVVRQVPEPAPSRAADEDLTALRGITARRDRAALIELLPDSRELVVLQHLGDALLAVGVEGLAEQARSLERRLRERDHEGDAELAELLVARLDDRRLDGQLVPADLDQVSDLLEGGLFQQSGGWLDLETGDCVPALDYLDALDEELRPDPESERWLWLGAAGARDRWRDRRDFAHSLPSSPQGERLLRALDGRGAFRRFSRELDRAPELLPRWRAYSAERRRGRARAVLAGLGYLALPPQR